MSLFPRIAELIEKTFDKNDTIYRYQSGFRKYFFADSCLSSLNNKTATSLSFYTGMILIDLQKAFHTINHDILRNKLGLSQEATEWFKFYLPNRKFKVHIQSIQSFLQGCILGPLFFLLHTNEMPQIGE